jgi:hypothetical protein
MANPEEHLEREKEISDAEVFMTPRKEAPVPKPALASEVDMVLIRGDS